MPVNQLEQFRATVRHKSHDAILYYANFTPDLERRIREAEVRPEDASVPHFGMFARPSVALRPPPDRSDPDFGSYYADIDRPDDAFINRLGVLEIPSHLYHLTGYVSPLRNAVSLSDLETFPYPNVNDFTDDHMVAEVDAIHARGRVAFGVIGHIYEDSWQIRGYEEFLIDMMEPSGVVRTHPRSDQGAKPRHGMRRSSRGRRHAGDGR